MGHHIDSLTIKSRQDRRCVPYPQPRTEMAWLVNAGGHFHVNLLLPADAAAGRRPCTLVDDLPLSPGSWGRRWRWT